MLRRARLRILLKSPLLAGGFSSPTAYLDSVTARDGQGRPFIPASTVKGALREALGRLAPALPGGVLCNIVQPCSDGKCVVCRLFGREGAGRGAALGQEEPASQVSAAGALHISDAELDPGSPRLADEPYSVRPGVGIDRHQRSASQGLLFQREVVDAVGAEFFASVTADDLSESDWLAFRRSLVLATGVGNSRTRGLGHVEMSLESDIDAIQAESLVVSDDAFGDGTAILDVELLEPALVGAITPDDGFVDTLDFIPGAAIRGALGSAAARVLGKDEDGLLERLFASPESCLLFSDALPLSLSNDRHLPVRMPFSQLECPHAGLAAHAGESDSPGRAYLFDGLLRMGLVPDLLMRYGGAPIRQVCPRPDCGAHLRPARPGFWPRTSPVTRVSTRLARDPATGSSLPGMLYTVSTIEKGTIFRGTVARMCPEASALLRRLGATEIRIGRGRTRGQGLVRLRFRTQKECLSGTALKARREAEDDRMQPFLPLLAAVSGLPVSGALAVLARTDLALRPEQSTQEVLSSVFGERQTGARCLAVAQRTGVRSGWQLALRGSQEGPRPLVPVVLAGSAWLFVYVADSAPDLMRLHQLEYQGLGFHRELGMGRLMFSHILFGLGQDQSTERNRRNS